MYYKIIISFIFIAWISIHSYFLQINTVLKNSLSFEYLKLAKYFSNWDLRWIWDWSIWFLYSLLIWIFEKTVNIINSEIYSWQINDTFMVSAKTLNIFLFFVSWVLLYRIWKKYLFRTYNSLLIMAFFLSPTLIKLNTNISSENLMIPLFLWIFLLLDNFINEILVRREIIRIRWKNIELNNKKEVVLISFFIAILLAFIYFTNPFSYIIIFWIILIIFHLMFLKKESSYLKWFSSIWLISWFFLLIILPYLIYINNLDIWNKQIINTYNYSFETKSDLQNIDIIKDKNNDELLNEFISNQKKVFVSILPWLVISDVLKAYENENFILWKSNFFLVFSIFPLFLIIYWTYKLLFTRIIRLTEKKNLMLISIYIFICFSIFLSLTYISEKDLIIFLPLILVVMVYWWQEILYNEDYNSSMFSYVFKYVWVIFIISWLFVSWIWNYYSTYNDDYKYQLKKDLWISIKEKNIENKENLWIMEDIPTITYYAWEENSFNIPKWINLNDLIKYAKENKINFLVVDSFDFPELHPNLDFLIENGEKHQWLELYNSYEKLWEKILIYKII